ncbi:hypothetical protein [Nostoc sp.]
MYKFFPRLGWANLRFAAMLLPQGQTNHQLAGDHAQPDELPLLLAIAEVFLFESG